MPLDPEDPQYIDVPYNEIDTRKWNLAYSQDDQQGDTTWKRGFQAFWQRESWAGSMQQRTEFDFHTESSPEEEALWESGKWNAFDYILPNSPLHADRYASQVSQIKNIRELAQFEGRAIKEEKNTAIVYNMSLGKTAVLGLATGLTDPITLPLLFYAPAVRGASLGMRVAKLGGYGAADQALREGLIAPNQLDRPWQESVLNVTAGALLSGAVGGALGVKFKPAVNKQTAKSYNDLLLGEDNFAKSFDQNVPKYVFTDNPDIPTYTRVDDPLERTGRIGMYTLPHQKIIAKDMDQIITGDPDRITAIDEALVENDAAYKDKAIELDEYDSNKAILESDKLHLQREALEIRNEGLVNKLTFGARVTSQQTLALSPSPWARTYAWHALEVPYAPKYFDHADLGGHAALTEQFKGHLNASYGFREAYVSSLDKYAKAEGMPMIKRWLGKAFGNEEFNIRLRKAMYSGDTDPENELFTHVAQQMRKVIDRITKPLIDAEVLAGTNTTREKSWFPIVMDSRKTMGNEVAFGNDIATGWGVRAQEDAEIIARHQVELEQETPVLLKQARDEWNKVESPKGKKLVAKKKADLEKEALQNYHKRLKEIDKIANKGKKSDNQKSAYIARELPKAQERLTTTRAKNEDVLKSFAKKVNSERAVRRKEFVAKFEKERASTIKKEIDAEKEDSMVFVKDMDDRAVQKMGYEMATFISELGKHQNVIEADIFEALTTHPSSPFHANPSFLKKRTLNVPQEYLDKWTMSDVITALDTFSRRATGLTALRSRFGTMTPDPIIERIHKDYNILTRDPRIDGKQKEKLENRRTKDIDMVKHTWTALLGKSPDYSGVSRTTRDVITAVRGMETMQHLGLSGLSALEDLAAMPLHLGIRPMYGALREFIKRSDVHNMTKNTMADLSVASEAAMADTSLSRIVGESLPTTANWAHKTHVAVTYYLKSTLMPAIDRITKSMVSYTMLSRLSRAAVEGGSLEPFERALLRKYGLSDDMLERGMVQMRKYASKPGGDEDGYLHNPDLWRDKEAQIELDMAVSRASRQIISTPNIGNQNKMMSHSVYGTLLQFKSHMIGTTDNHLIPIVQQAASGTATERLNILFYSLLGFSLSAMNYNVRAALSGREADNSKSNLVKQFVTRTGGAGVWGMVMGIGDDQLGISRALTGEDMQYFQQRSVWDGIFGPAPGTLDDALKTASMIPSFLSGEGVDRSQVAGAVRMAPFQNHWAAIMPVKAATRYMQEAVSDE